VRTLHDQHTTPSSLARQALVEHALICFIVTGDQELKSVGKPMFEFVVA